ncbi:phage tail tape measure protein [Vibrio cyclitrophicus]|uniref:phage tail tape measure protein n=1 Tax=Vibrio cyclitrophicus TaxID=47951 RepID=UPI000C82BBC9|nr:phage tail tape measure protein [Vibrio cyclitrophicus]PMF18933.1 phage tail tape measure protein [Vibrio cyclitrophicus]
MLPDSLKFQVGLIDQISKPLGNIQRQMTDVTNTYRQGTQTMVTGAAGMVSAGFALQKALMPAIEMDRALGEVKSLGVADEQLQQLSDTALEFSVKYGKSATDFVAASYDIKSAMGDMTGDELSGVTRSSAILAAATKADTATITNYMGTMYSVFKDQAEAIGKDNWAEQLAGMTAKSVEMFKTTGQGMSDAFKGIGALGKTHGVAVQEQMAVLGMLQGSMSGSEAGTRYKAFLGGVVKAQDQLGMSFTDSNGKMLPMFEIMDQLKNKYGDLDSVEIAEITTAFGGSQAAMVITDLISKSGDLQANIKDLNDASNLGTAEQMAGAMTDQWERLEQGVFAISAAFGAVLLPAILPVVGGMADGATTIIQWTQLFPNLAKYIGFAAVAILGAVAAGGAFTLMMGISKQVMATYMITMKLFAGVNFLLTQGMGALRVAMLAANIAIAANPIILVVGAVIAAVAAVGALIYYWDDLKASFGDTTWFQVLEGAITLITMPFRAMFEFIKAGWQWVMSGFTDTSGFAFIGQMADSMRNIFGSVFSWFSDKLAGIWETMKGLVDWLPGFGSEEETAPVSSKAVKSATPYAQIQPGGAAKSIANHQTSSTNYGGVSMYVQQMNNPQDMASELEMAAG